MSAKRVCHAMEMQHVRTHQEVTTVPVLKDLVEMGQCVQVFYPTNNWVLTMNNAYGFNSCYGIFFISRSISFSMHHFPRTDKQETRHHSWYFQFSNYF